MGPLPRLGCILVALAPLCSCGGSPAPPDGAVVVPDGGAELVDGATPLDDLLLTGRSDGNAGASDLAMRPGSDLAMSASSDLAMRPGSDLAMSASSDLAMSASADLAMSAKPDLAMQPSPDLAMGHPPADMAMNQLPPDMAQVIVGPDLTFYSGNVALGTPIIDAAPDEAGNIWAVAPDALYIMRRGDASFRRYTNQDGLHIYSEITTVAGAGPNEGFVGLEGYVSDNPDLDTPAQRIVGKAEHVRLQVDGSITSLHYADLHNDNSDNYWHTRSARRLLYVHTGPNAGHLFMGGNHGVTNILNDGWGDHIHVQVLWMPEQSQALGEWYGLAVDPATNGVWTCGRYGCGLQNFVADPKAWVTSKGYIYAFTVFTGNHDLQVPHGYHEEHRGVAVTPDGTAWFLSALYGVASWNPNSGTYTAIANRNVPGLGTGVDIAADPDGSVWIADSNHVLRYQPQNGSATTLALPAGDIRHLYVDTLSNPRAVYISTGGGLAIYRGK